MDGVQAVDDAEGAPPSPGNYPGATCLQGRPCHGGRICARHETVWIGLGWGPTRPVTRFEAEEAERLPLFSQRGLFG